MRGNDGLQVEIMGELSWTQVILGSRGGPDRATE
jgi:hypothetical protein